MPETSIVTSNVLGGAGAVSQDWWRGAVIYQIYPRSYQDSNGDGVGDLQGIIDRMAYVAALGVDAIWISPFFTSPMQDFGYDIADYRNVDPLFGDIGVFENLVKSAHERGLKVLIDLVLSHTSDIHPWFQQSRLSRTGAKSDYYVWADALPDGSPPNNWLAVFGGSAWEWDGIRQQYYLHNFLSTQPDLNFHNPVVREEVLDVVRYWLDFGVDGIRLDTVNFYYCDRELRSNPPLPKSEMNSAIAPSVNPYNFQKHIFDKNRPENLDFLRLLRKTLDHYGARIALGEVGDAQRGLEIMAEYTKDDSLLHSCYAFELLSGSQISAKRVCDTVSKFESSAPDGNPTWAFSNHDVVRHTTRWGLNSEAQKTLLTMLMCLRGLACLYQGEELGLPEAKLSHEQIRDPYGHRFWPRFTGRDGCRTPMVWESDKQNGGFSDAEPWLPVPDDHRSLAVSTQETDSESMLRHYRKLISLRHKWPILKVGALKEIRADGDVLTLVRTNSTRGGEMHCVFNLGDKAVETLVRTGTRSVVVGEFKPLNEGQILLQGWSSAIFHYE